MKKKAKILLVFFYLYFILYELINKLARQIQELPTIYF